MKMNAVTDDNNQPKVGADGVPRKETYFSLAVPKQPSVPDWKQTDWGRSFVAAGMAAWPKGEWNFPHFAWKVVDGDSTVPDRSGKPPCQKEGFAGHWVVKCSTGLPVTCVVAPDIGTPIIDANAIKCGDYGRVLLNLAGNDYPKNPGIYVNPSAFCKDRDGAEIVTSESVDTVAAFGGGQPAPAPAPYTPPAPAPAPMPSAPDFAQGPAVPPPPAAAPTPPPPPAEEKYNVSGTICTRAQLEAAKWSPAQIADLPRA